MNSRPIRLAILGAGGLGKGMLQRALHHSDVSVVAIADSGAYCFDNDGLAIDPILKTTTLSELSDAIPCDNPIMELFKTHANDINAVFVALPNLPVTFIPNVVRDIIEQTGFSGVFVDALKRTTAVQTMMNLDGLCRSRDVLYITGAGATPGFLSTVAAVAAQSFVYVNHIDIRFGVGISNWESYRATIREDFIHLDGFDAERVAKMSDAEIKAELDKRNGLIELVNMEHADDVILELAGVCDRSQVTVGGLVDTRNAKKPISTTVTITGKTSSGEEGTHTFTLSDSTTMVDNVCGPALGFARRGIQYHNREIFGVITSADLMPLGPQAVAQPALTAV